MDSHSRHDRLFNIFIDDIPDRLYDANDFISQSHIKKFMVSGKHYLNSINQESDSTALKIGTAVHMKCLQPEKFNQIYLIAPKCDRRTNEGKRVWADFVAGSTPWNVVLTEEENELVCNISKSVTENPFFKTAIENTNHLECGIFSEFWGSKVKGRIDLYNEQLNLIVDIKTTSKIPTPQNIKYEILKNGYDIQSFFYKKLVFNATGKIPKFVFLFVEKTSPYSVGLATIEDFAHEEAIGEKVQKAVISLTNCTSEGRWFGLPNEQTPATISFSGIDTTQVEDTTD